MKILLLGSGGREHALAWKLAQSPHTTELWCAPGNAGMALERVQKTDAPVQCISIGVDDFPALLRFAGRYQPDLTVVGPDNPLAMGIVDNFRSNKFRIWGPTKRAAQFESSKAFSQHFMQRYGIPTARAGAFGNAFAAKVFAREFDGRCAVKADGLALGKGVLICHSNKEAGDAIDSILLNRSFGDAGATIVIQELLEGQEISLHAICDGKTAKLFPTSQDHKRALDNDKGLNTGGMGTYSPTPFLTDAELEEAGRQILEPWMKGCAAEGIEFQGILYPGIILTDRGPKVIEFNARFGDPEAQVYLMRLETDLVELLDASVSGTLDKIDLRWNPKPAVCVVMASGGYPGSYPKDLPITFPDKIPPNTKVFHAGTASKDGQIVTNGGRVLGVTALGADLAAAQANAYDLVSQIRFQGAHYRKDIAAKALSESLSL